MKGDARLKSQSWPPLLVPTWKARHLSGDERKTVDKLLACARAPTRNDLELRRKLSRGVKTGLLLVGVFGHLARELSGKSGGILVDRYNKWGEVSSSLGWLVLLARIMNPRITREDAKRVYLRDLFAFTKTGVVSEIFLFSRWDWRISRCLHGGHWFVRPSMGAPPKGCFLHARAGVLARHYVKVKSRPVLDGV